MLDYLKGVGLESATAGLENNPLYDGAREVVRALEGMSDDEVVDLLCAGLESDLNVFKTNKDLYFDHLHAEMTSGTESAYVTNRSLVKNAWIRLKMMFKWDKEKAVVEYAEVLRNLDPAVITRGYSDLIMGKESVLAYNDLMQIANELTMGMDRKDIEVMLVNLGDKIDGRIKKIILSILLIYVPIVNLLALSYLLYLNWVLPKEAEDLNNAYGNDLRKMITKAISKTTAAKVLGLKEKNGLYDTSDLIKFVSYINKLKATMIPMKHRRIMSLPDFLKSTTAVSYEDKVAMVETLKANTEMYLDTLGNSPSKRMNAMRFVLSSDQITQNAEYGMPMGLASEEAIYAGMAESLNLCFVDLVSATMMLVRDLKKY